MKSLLTGEHLALVVFGPAVLIAGATLTVLVALLSVDAVAHYRRLWRIRMTRRELRNEALAEAHARMEAEHSAAGALAHALAVRAAEAARQPAPAVVLDHIDTEVPIPYELGEIVATKRADPIADFLAFRARRDGWPI